MTPPEPPVKVLVDTDGGIDDAAALWFLLTRPDVDLLGVAAGWGNVGPVEAANNVCAVLEAAGRTDVIVAVGAAGPIGAAPNLAPATFVHGDGGLGPATPVARLKSLVDDAAADLLSSTTRRDPGDITVVALGPLSTLAQLVADDPTWPATVGRLVVMGGAIAVPGNALPAGEANIAHDPAAAQIVLGAGWRRPPLLVPLDVTHRATLDDAHFALLRERRTPAALFLDAPLHFYRRGGSRLVPDHRCPCHDLLAAIAAVDRHIVSGPTVEVAVDTGGGSAWGSTIADLRPLAAGTSGGSIPFRRVGPTAPVEVGLDVDVERFHEHVERLFGAR